MTSPSGALAAVKTQGPHFPTLVYAVGIALAALVVYHLFHRRR